MQDEFSSQSLQVNLNDICQSIHTFITVRYIKKEVLFVVFLVQLAHGGARGRNDVIDKKEQSVFRSQVDTFPNEKIKLTH